MCTLLIRLIPEASMNFNSIRWSVAVAVVIVIVSVGYSQSTGPKARYSATTANTSSPGDTVRFDIIRWSTDMEREQLFTAVQNSGDMGLLALLQKAPTIGYIWTTETAGYPLRYAYLVSMADGGDRLILAIDRKLGSFEPQRWKLTGAAPLTDYPFTVIELRVSKAGVGEGKSSLNSKITADTTAKTIALDNYAAAPILFQSVKK
jgi:hypothetical protein